jgi:hypothetical protein
VVVKFVAYIDESGDTGLEEVKRPNLTKGASEWLVLSCFLVRESDDHKCVGWIQETLSKYKNNQSRSLHFADLIPVKKTIACEDAAKRPGRYFIVASNKKNMEYYENQRAAAASGDKGTSWLYWWLSRLLLERVTEFCEERVPPKNRGDWKLRIVFSRRGGLIYKDFERYLTRLHWQSVFGTQYIDQGDISWSMIDWEEIFVLDHSNRAGLQLADIGAGAFFCALEQNRPANCDPSYAKLLKPRMAFDKKSNILGFGLKTMPSLYEMGLAAEQREIFEFYGYSPNGW